MMLKRRMLIVAATAAAIGLTGQSAFAAEGWTAEKVPYQPDKTASTLDTGASADGVTWAFGGWRVGRDPSVSQGFRKDAEGEWKEAEVPNVGRVLDSEVLGADDVWISGEGGDDTQVRHWDGENWTGAPIEAEGGRVSVSAITSADGQIWAAGSFSGVGAENRPYATFWDGEKWVDTEMPNDTTAYGRGIAASAPNDVWVIGSGYIQTAGLQERPRAMHWDGESWTDTPMPDLPDTFLNDITVVAPDDVWAVGERGVNPESPVLVHWDGKAWSEVPPQDDLQGGVERVGVVDGEVWAVGSKYGDTHPLVLRYDGENWQQETGVPNGTVHGVSEGADGGPLLVGELETEPGTTEPAVATRG